jgi:hypothetical protein
MHFLLSKSITRAIRRTSTYEPVYRSPLHGLPGTPSVPIGVFPGIITSGCDSAIAIKHEPLGYILSSLPGFCTCPEQDITPFLPLYHSITLPLPHSLTLPLSPSCPRTLIFSNPRLILLNAVLDLTPDTRFHLVSGCDKCIQKTICTGISHSKNMTNLKAGILSF